MQEHRYHADIGRCIGEGWALYKREPLLLSGATLLMAVVNAIAGNIPLLNLALYGPLLGGLYILVMRIDRGEPVRFSNYFEAFNAFLPLLLASVVMSLLIFLGFLLLILPGVFLALAYGFTTLNIVDRRMDFWPAMEDSRRTITRHFWQYLLLALLFMGLCLLGAIPFGLGLLVAVPVCIGAQYCYYRDLHRFYGDAEDPGSGTTIA
jgi:uncharacterized membrane protein